MSENLYLAQGPAKLATDEDIEKDEEGITKPNLHRRIDRDLAELEEGEVEKDNFTLTVQSTNSYRNTQHFVHDEDGDSEIP